MNFIEAVIYTTTQGIEELTARLTMLGVSGFVIEDAQDFEEFLQDTTIYWDYVDDELMKLKEQESNIKIYVTDDRQGKELLDAVRDQVKALKAADTQKIFGRLEIILTNVKQEDWDSNWKQYFKPFEVGQKFVIKPSWEEYTKDTPRTILEIDPASSFGTGSHHTTQLCLIALENIIQGGECVLDMGCGTGILGIGALLLGADSVMAVDIDEHSTKAARDNAQKNGIDRQRFHTLSGNVNTQNQLKLQIGQKKYDVIVANIVADVIIGMADILKGFCKPGGVLVVSGIIMQRAQEVQNALKDAGFFLQSQSEQNDWCALQLSS